jgi:anti-sigma-K factor RskA
MSEDLDQIAAAYALGLSRGAARKEIESRLSAEPALREKAEFWQQQLAVLDLAAPQEAPPQTNSSIRSFNQLAPMSRSLPALLPGVPVPASGPRWRRA